MTIKHRYTLAELEALPTITVGQADDLKIDTGDGTRVWLSRAEVEDGAPYNNQVTVERYIDDCWVDVETYQAEEGNT